MTKEEIKELIIARLSVMPSNRKISIGSLGSYTKDELIVHVNQDDKIGKKITEVEMAFLRAIKEGTVYA
jgi:hypothetical protein